MATVPFGVFWCHTACRRTPFERCYASKAFFSPLLNRSNIWASVSSYGEYKDVDQS